MSEQSYRQFDLGVGPVRRTLGTACFLLLLLAFSGARAQGVGRTRGDGSIANPVVPGDHPDPSIIRVGNTYWMSSTSGDWSPQFPLFRSTDLQHWTAAGAVFPHQPAWATGSFWAPELVYDQGEVVVYYVARKRDGPLCVAVATSANPAGPYFDHGPIVCQPDGSIDPAFARDASGKPYLIWKEDGNSESKPTPLWAQPLRPELLQLTGTKTQILVNDPAGWEGGVVEAPFVLRHEGKFYLFYAGNACCGGGCKYAEGVARADTLLGPYEKDPANPVIRPNGTWKCPGHGSAVSTPKGEDYFLYHAYSNTGSIYLGRESILDRITWGPDGWPAVNHGAGPGETVQATAKAAVIDLFEGKRLGPGWQWPVNHEPKITLERGTLRLTANGTGERSFIARAIGASDYVSTVEVQGGAGCMGSLAVIGNREHASGLGRRGATLELWQKNGAAARTVLWTGEVAERGRLLVRVESTDGGKHLQYQYRAGGGQWTDAGAPLDVSLLPQWDQGLRVGLVVEGEEGSSAQFRGFRIQP